MSTVIEILNSVLELFVVLFFFNQMLKRREISPLCRYAVVFCVLLVHIVRSFIPIQTYLNLGLTAVLWVVLLVFLYNDTIIRKLAAFLLYFVAVFIVEILCRFILSSMIGSIYGPHSTTPGLERYIGMALTNVLLFSILAVIAIAARGKRSDVTLKYRVMMLLFPLFSLFIVISADIFIMISGTSDIRYIFALLFIIIGLIYFNVVTFDFMDTYSAKIRLSAAEEVISSQAESYKLLEINEGELRKLRHNINEHMEVIKEMVVRGSFSDSVELSDSLEKLSSIQTSLVYTGDVAVDAILNVEARKAAECGIKYLTKLQNLTAPINIAAIDKSTILCNTLNNAIEACQKIKNGDKFIVIDIGSDDEKIRIRIENSSLPMDVRNGKIYSTKKDSFNHGIGIESVKSSLKKYNGSMDISYSDGITTCVMQLDNTTSDIHA